MATINLTNQATAAAALESGKTSLIALLDQRKPVWNKIDRTKKLKWISGADDPVMTLAWQNYQYLCLFFDGLENEGKGLTSTGVGGAKNG